MGIRLATLQGLVTNSTTGYWREISPVIQPGAMGPWSSGSAGRWIWIHPGWNRNGTIVNAWQKPNPITDETLITTQPVIQQNSQQQINTERNAVIDPGPVKAADSELIFGLSITQIILISGVIILLIYFLKK